MPREAGRRPRERQIALRRNGLARRQASGQSRTAEAALAEAGPRGELGLAARSLGSEP